MSESHVYQPEGGGLLFYKATMARYMDHAREPNVDFSEVAVDVATRDVAAADELTCNHRDFMADLFHIEYL